MPGCFASSLNPNKKLRPYQMECFQYFLTYWQNSFEEKEPWPHLLFHMATGSGKTLIMAGLILYLYEQGYRNFLFFVNSNNIIEKTKENFLNPASPKYLFGQTINIGNKQVEIRLVENFQVVDDSCINLCLTTIQGLHSALNTPKENAVTYDDFADKRIVLISDEAHHMNAATVRGNSNSALPGMEVTEDWESTVMRIFRSNDANVLLEFTATQDFNNANIAEKYENKVIFDYPLKKFREDGYSKDIMVVQSDLSAIDRAIQAVLLSQYKRKLFASIHQDIKPVLLCKSKTINDNKNFFDEFIAAIRHLNVDDIKRVEARAADDLKEMFAYLDESKIDFENLVLEIKEDFREDNLLLVDGNNVSPEKQVKLNSLEDKENPYRVVFAVDMLNEGWDVLNLFDIVRLYDTRDARSGRIGKTTMQEAQLIGRGARYMPFKAPSAHRPVGMRKYDSDADNRLRVLETLHYHSATNPRYITELTQALVQTGAMPEKHKEIDLKLKDSFKQTALYRKGIVFSNNRSSYVIGADKTGLETSIIEKVYKVRLRSERMSSKMVFKFDADSAEPAMSSRLLMMPELGCHLIRSAINTFDCYKFSSLKIAYPNLKSIREFIESQSYLAAIQIEVQSAADVLKNLTQSQKLQIAINVLHQIEPQLAKGGVGYKGTTSFEPRMIKDVFRDHKLKFTITGSSDKELGKSMKDSENLLLRADLSATDWHAYEDCFGTSEEKYLIRYIESIYPKLVEKYHDIYLLRNEKDLRLYAFDNGAAYEPDYVLFLNARNEDSKIDYIQIFIEPKGSHLRVTDKWKEDALKSIRELADIRFSTQTSNFNVWGLPFFTEQFCRDFDRAVKDCLL